MGGCAPARLQARARERLGRNLGHGAVLSSGQHLNARATHSSAGALLATACALAGLLWAAAPAHAETRFAPRHGQVWHGVSDTGSGRDFRHFNRQVGTHTALLQSFFHWGVPLTTGALDRWEGTKTRGVLSLSTAPGGQPEVVTPRQLAMGFSDHYMLRLGGSIASSDQVVYIRPFAEMNLHLNPYSAFNADGSRRRGHSTKMFIKAWKRLVLIVRGGSRDNVNRRLLRIGMPRIHRAKSNNAKKYKRLGVRPHLKEPRVAFQWMPLTRGSPNVAGNSPHDYFPGRRWVDWVGTDVYAKFSNHTLWSLLRGFYRRYDRWPFAIGEYGPWDNDQSGAFTARIHQWARKRPRVKALIYFRSVDPQNEFNLQYYPGARRALRGTLDAPRFQEFAPGTRR